MITREYKPDGVDVTFEMIPFRTVKVDMVIHEVEKIIPPSEQDTYHKVFTNLEGYTRNIRFGDNLPLEWQALREYWQTRTRDISANLDRFFELMSADVMWVWWEAWKATRDTTNAAPPELSAEAAESKDPNSVSDGSKPSQTSKPSGKGKRKSVLEQVGLTPDS